MGKIGRNDPCWCNSGKKYKKCHLGRDKQEPFTRGEAQGALRLFTTTSKCSVPDAKKYECHSRIVRAHTLSKGNSLKNIAHQGHVLGLKHGLSNIERKNGGFEFERIGINQASTFSGFCSYHDKELFSCIEDEKFQATKKQCTMLAYRPLMREFYVKEANYKFMQQSREFDRGWAFQDQLAWARMADENVNGAKLSLKDLEYIRGKVELSIEDNSFNALKHVVLRLNNIPKIMACGMHGPITDIFGRVIQDITSDENIRPAYIITNLLAFDCIGYMIFSWLPEDDEIILKFVGSLRECDMFELGDRLANYIFTFHENIFASEIWWNDMGDVQERVNSLLMQGVIAHAYDISLIEDDDFKYDAISVKDIIELY